MSRRTLSIVLFIGLLAFSWLLATNNKVKALTPTPSPSITITPTQPHDYVSLPSSGPAPLTVQFVNTGSTTPNQIILCSWSFTDGGAGGMVNFSAGPGNYFSSCPTTYHIFPNGGSFTTTLNLLGVPNSGGVLIKVGDVNVPGPTATYAPFNGTMPDLIMTIVSFSSATCSSPAGFSVGIINGGGGGAAGPFVVSYGSQKQTVSGLDFTKEAYVSFTLEGTGGWVTPVVDSTNMVAEINEANNSWAAWMPTPAAPPPTCTPATPATVTQTPTRTNTPGITNTPTRTPTRTNTGTITRTPTNGPSLTPTRTATITLTPTSTVALTTCSPVSYTITTPFTFDGAGSFCWQTSALGSYINSWNTSSVMVNAINITNTYVPAASYPAKVNGFYYIGYNSNSAWGHFETK